MDVNEAYLSQIVETVRKVCLVRIFHIVLYGGVVLQV